MLEVKLSNNAKKFLKNAEHDVYDRIMHRIDSLKINPIPQDAKTIQGSSNRVFRVRAGKNRILYEIYSSENYILVVKIDKREKVYD